jgi:hypothetical protein
MVARRLQTKGLSPFPKHPLCSGLDEQYRYLYLIGLSVLQLEAWHSLLCN